MRILLLLSESWNDKAAPNNNMTNWFTGFPDAEVWTISGSSLLPNNACCDNYFLIGENDMLRSIFSGIKAGKRYQIEREKAAFPLQNQKERDISDNQRLKKIFAGECARLARDIVWRYGRYDLNALRQFVEECNPDIIFSQRKGSVKMCRLETVVKSMTNAPMVAYTGDDEYSLHQVSFSPIFWIRRFWTRAWLRRTIPNYKLFYSQSERQMREFERVFHANTKFLVKCGTFSEEKVHRQVNDPIQMVYAGKLYCNRWKTLVLIAEAIREVNHRYGAPKIQLNIYTGDTISKKQNTLLNDGTDSIIHGKVSASQLPAIYAHSDVVLHVESFDLRNRLLTKDSFSTKVMDSLSSGCAVMAVCWEGHAAYQYLKKQDAAITASGMEEIRQQIQKLANNPAVACEYADKAYRCGAEHHQRNMIQTMMREDFNRVINRC